MVGFKNLGWLPEPTRRRISAGGGKKEGPKLEILAFETAKTMSRLVSLYKSLSDDEIFRLKNDIIKSEGVAFLNSRDEGFLLSLACAEKLEDLDRAAGSVSRLGKKCDDFGLNRFDLVYGDLKLGLVDFGKLEYGSRVVEKKIKEMEKLVSGTAALQAALESLTGLEISERKLKLLKNRQMELQKEINFDFFAQKLENQRKEVKYLRGISLWSKSFDKSVDLMARIVCVVHARICSVFGPQRKFSQEKFLPHSGPLLTRSKPILVRFYSLKSFLFFDDEDNAYGSARDDQEQAMMKNRVFHSAGPETVGGSGLALRYANLIVLAERYLEESTTISISHDERESLYQMLPENLKTLVRIKLSKKMKCLENENDESLAAGWRVAMAEMMRWLSPMAHDTVAWQMERNFEKMKFDRDEDGRHCCPVLLLQTLHFSDKEKTEAAIAEVLVGLSCIFRFENHRLV